MTDDFKPEPYVVKLEWWELDCGDSGKHKIGKKQLEGIKNADKSGARFVQLEELLVNIAFIRGAVRVKRSLRASDLEDNPLTKEDTKFIIEDKRKNLLITET